MTKSTQSPSQETGDSLIIDPVSMNIVNRIAPGTIQKGDLHCEGGLMVEGTIIGNITIKGGPLVLRTSGVLSGVLVVHGDAYLLGSIEAQSDDSLSEISVMGTVFLGSTLCAASNINAVSMKTYEGSRIDGRIRTGQWASPEGH